MVEQDEDLARLAKAYEERFVCGAAPAQLTVCADLAADSAAGDAARDAIVSAMRLAAEWRRSGAKQDPRAALHAILRAMDTLAEAKAVEWEALDELD